MGGEVIEVENPPLELNEGSEAQDMIKNAPFRHFYPWFSVLKDDSLSTPVRLVFDPTRNGLNVIQPMGENRMSLMSQYENLTVPPQDKTAIKEECFSEPFLIEQEEGGVHMLEKVDADNTFMKAERTGIQIKNPLTSLGWETVFSNISSPIDDLPLARGDTFTVSNLGFDILTANRIKLGRSNARSLEGGGLDLETSKIPTNILERNREIYALWFQLFVDNVHMFQMRPDKCSHLSMYIFYHKLIYVLFRGGEDGEVGMIRKETLASQGSKGMMSRESRTMDDKRKETLVALSSRDLTSRAARIMITRRKMISTPEMTLLIPRIAPNPWRTTEPLEKPIIMQDYCGYKPVMGRDTDATCMHRYLELYRFRKDCCDYPRNVLRAKDDEEQTLCLEELPKLPDWKPRRRGRKRPRYRSRAGQPAKRVMIQSQSNQVNLDGANPERIQDLGQDNAEIGSDPAPDPSVSSEYEESRSVPVVDPTKDGDEEKDVEVVVVELGDEESLDLKGTNDQKPSCRKIISEKSKKKKKGSAVVRSYDEIIKFGIYKNSDAEFDLEACFSGELI